MSPYKDVDGFHVINVGRMCLDQDSMLPATPWGVWEIIKRTGRHCPELDVWVSVRKEALAESLQIQGTYHTPQLTSLADTWMGFAI